MKDMHFAAKRTGRCHCDPGIEISVPGIVEFNAVVLDQFEIIGFKNLMVFRTGKHDFHAVNFCPLHEAVCGCAGLR